jgi:pimeloyl-ACP methyl ester carboxylesterase
MPYANNQGIRIYYEVEGQGQPLVLAHGMGGGGDLNAWRNTGYTYALKNDFQLVLFDLRGHGKSDKPTTSSTGSNAVDDIVSVLDSLDIAKAHYFGYSMGASAGFKQAISHADRFNSFILGGMTPGQWPEEMIKAVNISRELTKLRRTDPEAYFVEMESLLGHTMTPEERSAYLARDAETGSIEQATPHNNEPALSEQDLAGIKVPCLLYCGDLDPFHNGAQESVQHMPRAVFISMHGFNHITAFYRSDVVVPFVKQFLYVVNNKLPPES